jgi:hypothetical protein
VQAAQVMLNNSHFCFRNSKLEDFHDRISNDEMKALMIDVVNHSYLFLSVLFASKKSNEIIDMLKQGDLPRDWRDWNDPQISDELTRSAKRTLDLIKKARQAQVHLCSLQSTPEFTATKSAGGASYAQQLSFLFSQQQAGRFSRPDQQ